jgi:hypothetical protein
MKYAILAALITVTSPACVGSVDGPGGGGEGGADGSVGAADAGPGGSNADAAPGSPDATPPQPNCYTEPANPSVDISDLVASYGGANWKDELIEALTRRHPATGYLLDRQRNDSYFNQFSDSSSWTGMVGWLDTLSHEETHLFNAYHAQDVGQAAAIYMREDLILYMPSDQSFGRGEIYDDIAQSARDGIYAPTYLTGSQGQRGFNALLDELSCYLNEVAAVGLVGEYFQGGVSLRDGSVAFLYFMQVYLRVARTEFPQIYSQLQANPVYPELVETLWLRAHFFLEFADEFPGLGISDDMYRALMYEPANLAEIEMFTGNAVGNSNCLQ